MVMSRDSMEDIWQWAPDGNGLSIIIFWTYSDNFNALQLALKSVWIIVHFLRHSNLGGVYQLATTETSAETCMS